MGLVSISRYDANLLSFQYSVAVGSIPPPKHLPDLSDSCSSVLSGELSGNKGWDREETVL